MTGKLEWLLQRYQKNISWKLPSQVFIQSGLNFVRLIHVWTWSWTSDFQLIYLMFREDSQLISCLNNKINTGVLSSDFETTWWQSLSGSALSVFRLVTVTFTTEKSHWQSHYPILNESQLSIHCPCCNCWFNQCPGLNESQLSIHCPCCICWFNQCPGLKESQLSIHCPRCICWFNQCPGPSLLQMLYVVWSPAKEVSIVINHAQSSVVKRPCL